jgi:putative DNA primase/helicase
MDILAGLAQQCDKVRWRGQDGFTACCVAHQDRNPSMSVTQRDGKILAYCHAGCPQNAVIAALGLLNAHRGDRPFNKRQRPTNSVTDRSASTTRRYALELWMAANTANGFSNGKQIGTHPYAIRKGIKGASGAARGVASGSLIGKDADCLVVPMRTLQGALTGVECINPDGVKQTFGNKGVLILGNDLDKTLPQLIVEGWATAVAILNIYHWHACVYACFGKSMLDRIANEVAKKYPSRRVVIGGEA